MFQTAFAADDIYRLEYTVINNDGQKTSEGGAAFLPDQELNIPIYLGNAGLCVLNFIQMGEESMADKGIKVPRVLYTIMQTTSSGETKTPTIFSALLPLIFDKEIELFKGFGLTVKVKLSMPDKKK